MCEREREREYFSYIQMSESLQSEHYIGEYIQRISLRERNKNREREKEISPCVRLRERKRERLKRERQAC